MVAPNAFAICRRAQSLYENDDSALLFTAAHDRGPSLRTTPKIAIDDGAGRRVIS